MLAALYNKVPGRIASGGFRFYFGICMLYLPAAIRFRIREQHAF